MKAPFFTVLIDTYNYGHYVEDAVSSVLAQDFPAEEREILVVDDGSTDDTAARLRKFGQAIQYLHKPNGGQASAFNYGFERARGEIVALLDADDLWLPEKLRQLLLEAPRRWKYFRHLLSHPWTYGEIMTPRHRVYSYMKACAALVLGYHHLHLFEDARRKRKEWMAASSEKTRVAVKAKAAAATKS